MNYISRLGKSSILPSIATGAAAGIGMVGCTAYGIATKFNPLTSTISGLMRASNALIFNNLASYQQINSLAIKIAKPTALLDILPGKVWVGGAVVGGTVGLTVALGYEIGKRILKKDEAQEKDSSSIVPAGITGAVMGGIASVAPSVLINEGINYAFEKPIFGVLSIRGPKIMWQISKWTGRGTLDYVYSWIPSASVSSQELMVGAACGVAIAAAAAVTYGIAKKILQKPTPSIEQTQKPMAEQSPMPVAPSLKGSGRKISSAMIL